MLRNWKEEILRTDKRGYVQCCPTWKGSVKKLTDWNYRLNLINASLMRKYISAHGKCLKIHELLHLNKKSFCIKIQEKTGISKKTKPCHKNI